MKYVLRESGFPGNGRVIYLAFGEVCRLRATSGSQSPLTYKSA
jgi:hypothetical protein